MPSETGRIRARKLIVLPGGETLYIPCITQINFIDPVDRHQETDFTIDNTAQSNRSVHVDQVQSVPVDADGNPTGGGPLDGSLFVERVDKWNVLDPVDRHQETDTTLDNVTGADSLPPRFTTHKQTHIYRYFKDGSASSTTWVDSELIDEFIVKDPVDRSQETDYSLLNPFNGDLSGQASDSDPDITIGTGEGTSDNPIRVDPYQNIVNWSGPPPYLEFAFAAVSSGVSSAPVSGVGDHQILPQPAGFEYSQGYTTVYRIDSFPASGPASSNEGVVCNFSGGPSFSNTVAFSADKYMAQFGASTLPKAGTVRMSYSGTTVANDPVTGQPVPGVFSDGMAHYEAWNYPITAEHDWYTSGGVFNGSFSQCVDGDVFSVGVMTASGSWGWSGLTLVPIAGQGAYAGHTYVAFGMNAAGGIVCRVIS